MKPRSEFRIHPDAKVASYAEAWFETSKYNNPWTAAEVASYAEAWFETSRCCCRRPAARRRLLRGGVV